jgi:RNA polymerase sigma factor
MADPIIKADGIDDRAVAAKSSKESAESLIADFRPFMQSLATRYSTQYPGDQRDEILSVVMVAFYEAIRSYDIKRGHFFPFAERVIRARIIDFVRAASRYNNRTVALDELGQSQGVTQSGVLGEVARRQYDDLQKENDLRDEIVQFVAELETWGISFEVLSKRSPKHKRLLDTYRTVVRQIIEDPDIIQTIQIKRYFPVKAISEKTGLPPKKLERARIFVLASLIIHLGDYEYLSEYVAIKDL